MTATVLVTDAEQRSSLAVVRSLGRAGFQVHVCSSHPTPLAAASRFARSNTPVPDPLREPDRFVDSVSRLAKLASADVLLPMTDASVLAVLGDVLSFGSVKIPLPPLDVYRRAADKAAILEHARSVGFEVPNQQVVTASASRPAPCPLRFPVVLKPHRSVAAGAKLSVRHAADQAGLDAALASLPEAAFPVLIQERIVGPGMGLFLLLWGGRRYAGFAHRRLLEKPPSGGVSVRSVSISPGPELLDRAEELLRRIEWQGVAMVECKVDSLSMRPYLMEINGRFWGSLQLAVDAGVDFPVMLVRLALGLPVTPILDWRSGLKLRWCLGEVDHVLARLRHSRESLALPADAPGLGMVIAGILGAPFIGCRGEVLRWSDPGPGLREAWNWVRRR